MPLSPEGRRSTDPYAFPRLKIAGFGAKRQKFSENPLFNCLIRNYRAQKPKAREKFKKDQAGPHSTQ
jgi:hypothetical protein